MALITIRSREDPPFPANQTMMRRQHNSGSVYELRGMMLIMLKGMLCANALSLPWPSIIVVFFSLSCFNYAMDWLSDTTAVTDAINYPRELFEFFKLKLAHISSIVSE